MSIFLCSISAVFSTKDSVIIIVFAIQSVVGTVFTLYNSQRRPQSEALLKLLVPPDDEATEMSLQLSFSPIILEQLQALTFDFAACHQSCR